MNARWQGAARRIAGATAALCLASVAAASEPTNLDELRQRIEELRANSTAPGVAVVVVEKHQIVLAEGFGLARVSSGEPMTGDTLLRVGSLSKNLTALAIMKLVAQGKLTLDAPFAELAPEVALDNSWNDSHPITLRHLLTHTAGLEGSTYHEYGSSEPNVAPRDYARAISPHLEVRWPPGYFYSYANAGHTLAAVALENACGCAFDDYLEREIFGPLGMAQSTFRHRDEHSAVLAAGYTRDGKQEQIDWLMPIRPSGSMVSTVRELGRLIQFYSAPRSDEGLVPAALLDEMERRQPSVPGSLGANSSGYGHGSFAYFPARGYVMYGHSGSTQGFKTWLSYLPGEGAGFAVVANGGGNGLRSEYRTLLGRYVTRELPQQDLAPTIEASEQELAPLAGWYAPFTHNMTLRAGLAGVLGALRVQYVDGGLHVEPALPFVPGLSAYSLYPTGPATFRLKNHPLSTVAFFEDIEGRPVMTRREGYRKISAVRAIVPAVALLGAFLAALLVLLYLPMRGVLKLIGKAAPTRGVTLALGTAAAAWLLLAFSFVKNGLLGHTGTMVKLGTVSPTSLWLLALSVLGPLSCLIALWQTRQLAGRRAMRSFGVVAGVLLASGWVLLAAIGWVPFVTFRP
ncbi:MAG: serine hydrolase domain-containing protein [Pseudomonadota bacterium]